MLSSGAAGFHFAEPQWVPALLLIPLLWGMYRLFKANTQQGQKLRAFADAHLLPYLLEDHRAAGGGFSALHSLTLWSIVWACAVLAMAGPRWDYTDTKVYRPSGELIILLDLSRSMDVADVKPSRLARARQEIGDVLHYSQGVNIGLVAFAKIPHMIAPLTDDRQTLMRLLPSIKTELVYTQGSRLVQALDMAGRMLSQDQAKIERHVLILSDGGYEDPEAQIYRAIRALTDRGVRIHVIGVGTTQGGPVPNGQGGFYRGRTGSAIIAPADFGRLRGIARDGQGVYLEATYQQEDTRAFLAEIGAGQADEQEDGERVIRQWEERFYIFLLPGLLLILTWFRRGAVFPAVLVALMLVPAPARADSVRDYFLTEEQKGRKALEEKNFEQAEEIFKDDAYRRGVVQYKAGDYEGAAESFDQADRPEVAEDARYNLGNARLMAGRIEDAIKAYEEVLKGNPEHQDAAHNLEIARKMLEEQQQDQKSDQNQQNQADQNQQQADQKPQKGEQSQEQKQEENSQQAEKQQEQGEQQPSEGQDEASKDQGEQQQQAGKDSANQDPQQAEKQQEQQPSEGQDKASKDQGEEQQQAGKDSADQDSQKAEGEQENEQDKAQSEAKDPSQTKPSDTSEEGYPPQPGEEQKNAEAAKPKEGEQKKNQGEEQKQASSGEEAQPPEEQTPSGEGSQDQSEQEQGEKNTASEQEQKGEESSSSPAEPQPQPSQDQSGQPSDKPADTRPRLADGPVEPQGEGQPVRTPQDVDADRWLERIQSDTETFLKNKFYVESETQGAREGDKPW